MGAWCDRNVHATINMRPIWICQLQSLVLLVIFLLRKLHIVLLDIRTERFQKTASSKLIFHLSEHKRLYRRELEAEKLFSDSNILLIFRQHRALSLSLSHSASFLLYSDTIIQFSHFHIYINSEII